MVKTSKIRAVREKMRLSQEYLADRLKISQSAYARMESGQQKIEAGLLYKIARELQTPIHKFLEGDNTVLNGLKEDSSDGAQYYSVNKELYDLHLSLLKNAMAEVYQQRQELLDLLKVKLKEGD